MKQATTIEEQIKLLKSRGVIISDENKAKEVLMDIGYYRLGFIYSHLKKHIQNSKKEVMNIKKVLHFKVLLPCIIMILIYVIFCFVTLIE